MGPAAETSRLPVAQALGSRPHLGNWEGPRLGNWPVLLENSFARRPLTQGFSAHRNRVLTTCTALRTDRMVIITAGDGQYRSSCDGVCKSEVGQMRILAICCIIILMTLASGGCSDSADSQTSDVTYIETIVHRHADGSETITTRPVTLSEELRENAAREKGAGQESLHSGSSASLGTISEAISIDDGQCPGSDLWVYDQPNRLGNRICFHTDPIDYPFGSSVSLVNYCRGINYCYNYCCNPWAGAVRSYWPGSDTGSFASSATSHCRTFASWGPAVNAADSCEQSATVLVLSPQ